MNAREKQRTEIVQLTIIHFNGISCINYNWAKAE